jgi:hypothetical protein
LTESLFSQYTTVRIETMMKLLSITLFLAAHLGTANAESSNESSEAAKRNLRSHFGDMARSLQEMETRVLQPEIPDCSDIENLFDGQVSCECNLESATISYSCQLQNELCLGPICGSPGFSGTITIVGHTKTLSICIFDLTINDEAAPSSDDFCVDLTFSPGARIRSRPTPESCNARFGDVVCETCSPRKGGFSMGCSNVIEGATDESTKFDFSSILP